VPEAFEVRVIMAGAFFVVGLICLAGAVLAAVFLHSGKPTSDSSPGVH
jgi:hypothetical protein